MEQGIILKKFTKIGTINKSSNGLQALVYKQENGKLTKHLFKILVNKDKLLMKYYMEN